MPREGASQCLVEDDVGDDDDGEAWRERGEEAKEKKR